MLATYALIPARGGSKGIKRKNLLSIDGVPLFIRAAREAQKYSKHVYVSSDSDEILSIARLHGFNTVERPQRLATDEATVDEVVEDFRQMRDFPSTLVWQPTVVLKEGFSVRAMIGLGEHGIDPLALAAPTHGVWTKGMGGAERMNRQFVQRPQYKELGIRFYPAGTQEISPASTYELWESDTAVDIDTWDDFEFARHIVSTRDHHVAYEALVGPDVGYGHLTRVLSLAEATQGWDPRIVLQSRDANQKFIAGVEAYVEKRGFRAEWSGISNARDGTGVYVLDVLDTERLEVLDLKSQDWKVVTIEDHGSGSKYADLTINAMYDVGNDRYHSNVRSGSRYAVIRPEFLGHDGAQVPSNKILVTFGGTDPQDLTLLADRALGSTEDYEYRFITPPGKDLVMGPSSMAEQMAWADVVVCSGGRTVYEAAAMGKPAVVVTQNIREGTHTHLGPRHGNYLVGYGPWVTEEKLLEGIRNAFWSWTELSYRAKALVDGRGLDRIVKELKGLMEDD